MLMTKMRWELMSRGERSQTWSEEWEEERMLEKKVYGDTTHTLDFRKQRVTDMKSCKRIRLPQPRNNTEVILANLLQRLKEVTNSYLATQRRLIYRKQRKRDVKSEDKDKEI